MTAAADLPGAIGARPLPDASLIRLLGGLLRPHRAAAVAAVALGAVASLAEGLGLGLMVPFLQSMAPAATGGGGSNWVMDFLGTIFEGVPAARRLTLIAAAIFACVVLRSALVYGSSLLFNWLTVQIGHRLRGAIFEQVLTVDLRLLQAEGSARFLNALHTESWRTTQAVSTLLAAMITVVMLLVYVSLLVVISWRFTLVVMTLLVLITGLVQLLLRNVKGLGAETTATNAELARRMVDGVDGIEVIRSYGREQYERGRFEAASLRLNRLLVRLATLSGTVYPLYEVLVAAVLVGVLLFSAHGAADVAPLLVFVFVLYRLEPRVKELDRARVELVSLDAAVRDTLGLVEKEGKPYVKSGSRHCGELRQGIRFEHVDFRYDDGKWALRDVSLELPAGATTAIVGPSGAGKSTLIRLLIRFCDPISGRIIVDDAPLPELDVGEWRARIAVVSQKAFLFNASVFDNIAYGHENATLEQVEQAAGAAGAHEFITRLPDGYLTKLGENGVQLSGGEEQRVTVARALIRRPQLLILDEATNALDSISERLVQQALDALQRRCTIVVIAHRLSTIERADQIIVLQDGMVVERGNLAELMRLDGLFARLYRLQAPLQL